MDAKQFRELLEVSKDFKLKRFKINEVEVEFSEASHYNKEEQSFAPARELDADEQMLAHIEKLKSQALAGVKGI